MLEKFKEFRTLVETGTRKIENLHSDRGGEYISNDFNRYCKQHGIQRHLTAGYSLEQNGLVERKNCTLLEGI
jgi:transposase InsO family protein